MPDAYNWRAYDDIKVAIKAEFANLREGLTIGAAYTKNGLANIFITVIGTGKNYVVAYLLNQYGNITGLRTTNGGTSWSEYTIS